MVKFTPPDERERRNAIGRIESVAPKDKIFFQNIKSFNPIPAPGPTDWLQGHNEAGQTYEEFAQAPNKISKTRQKLAIVPITVTKDEPKIPNHFLQSLQEFACAFFDLEVEVTDYHKLDGVPHRRNQHSANVQVNCTVVIDKLRQLKASRLSYFALIAVTLYDLYPRDDWNFVFGLASSTSRVGVFSMARYFTEFPDLPKLSLKPTASPLHTDVKFLQRICKVMCHELCHMFNIKHCIFFHCIMNGSNNLQETDKRPLFLCPVCLRKLLLVSGFDLRKRYDDMLKFWTSRADVQSAQWLRKRIEETTAK